MNAYVLLLSTRSPNRWESAGTICRFKAQDDTAARSRALQELGRRSYQPTTAWGLLRADAEAAARAVGAWVLDTDGIWREQTDELPAESGP